MNNHELGGSIRELIEKLQNWQEQGYEDIDIDYGFDGYWFLKLVKYRPETFEEYATRVKAEEKDRKSALEKRKALYESLRKEFDPLAGE